MDFAVKHHNNDGKYAAPGIDGLYHCSQSGVPELNVGCVIALFVAQLAHAVVEINDWTCQCKERNS